MLCWLFSQRAERLSRFLTFSLRVSTAEQNTAALSELELVLKTVDGRIERTRFSPPGTSFERNYKFQLPSGVYNQALLYLRFEKGQKTGAHRVVITEPRVERIYPVDPEPRILQEQEYEVGQRLFLALPHFSLETVGVASERIDYWQYLTIPPEIAELALSLNLKQLTVPARSPNVVQLSLLIFTVSFGFGVLLLSFAGAPLAAIGKRLVALPPRKALAVTATCAAIASSYPVVFFGKSFVSPEVAGGVVYRAAPYAPGFRDFRSEDMRQSDIGAMMWQNVPYGVVQASAIFDHHEFPLWDRFNLGGLPLWGQGQSMLGDPLHLIVVAGRGAAWAWDLKFVMAKFLFAAGVGCAVYIASGSLLSSVLLTTSAPFIGFFAFRFNHLAYFSVAYSAWLLFYWLKILRAKDWLEMRREFVPLAFWSWMVVASGAQKESAILFGTCYLTGFLGLALRQGTAAMRLTYVVRFIFLTLGIGLLLSPLTLSFLQTVKISSYGEQNRYANPYDPRSMLGAFDSLFYQQAFDNLNGPSLNLFVLLGVLWALMSWRRLRSDNLYCALLGSGVAVFSVVFGYFPREWVLKMPFLRDIGHIGNTFSAAFLPVALVLAGVGVRELIEDAQQKRAWLKLCLFLVLVGGLLFWFYGWQIAAGRDPWLLNYSRPLVVSLIALLLLLPVALCFMPLVSGTFRPVLSSLAILAFVSLHLRHGLHLPTGINSLDALITNPGGRAKLSTPAWGYSTALEYVKNQLASNPGRVVGVGMTLFPGENGLYGLEGIGGADALISPQYSQLLRAVGIPRAMWEWLHILEVKDFASADAALDLLNVRFVVAPRDTTDLPSAYILRFRGDLDVWERPNSWPRAFFVNSFAGYRSVRGISELLKLSEQRPFAAIHFQDPRKKPRRLESDRVVVPATEYRLTSNSTSFKIEAPTAGVAVLSENEFGRDFTLYVNGVRSNYLTVNHAFKGVFLDQPGSYQITFSYFPRFIFSSMLLVLLGVGIFWTVKKAE